MLRARAEALSPQSPVLAVGEFVLPLLLGQHLPRFGEVLTTRVVKLLRPLTLVLLVVTAALSLAQPCPPRELVALDATVEHRTSVRLVIKAE
jgi:hypothetical protein